MYIHNCPECGKQYSTQEKVNRVKCPYCGASIDLTARRCSYCGTAFLYERPLNIERVADL